VPAAVARRITESLTIPTIGIGAGPGCDGQVLVWHDLLGLSNRTPARFVKRYADIGTEITRALQQYASEVRAGVFPADEHTYSIPEDELDLFTQATEEREHAEERDA
jgi:3-methyl-2-oxobutanoate hydroxymethyltransferase